MHNHVIHLIARVHRAINAVIEFRRCAILTISDRIACLLAVAEDTIIAVPVIRCMHDYIVDLVACVHCAVDAVIEFRWRAVLAIIDQVTCLFAVAEDIKVRSAPDVSFMISLHKRPGTG